MKYWKIVYFVCFIAFLLMASIVISRCVTDSDICTNTTKLERTTLSQIIDDTHINTLFAVIVSGYSIMMILLTEVSWSVPRKAFNINTKSERKAFYDFTFAMVMFTYASALFAVCVATITVTSYRQLHTYYAQLLYFFLMLSNIFQVIRRQIWSAQRNYLVLQWVANTVLVVGAIVYVVVNVGWLELSLFHLALLTPLFMTLGYEDVKINIT